MAPFDAARWLGGFVNHEASGLPAGCGAAGGGPAAFPLARMRAVLASLGDPQAALRRVVHVAGSKGKGSVVAGLAACLAAAGHSVGTYTSPHAGHVRRRVALWPARGRWRGAAAGGGGGGWAGCGRRAQPPGAPGAPLPRADWDALCRAAAPAIDALVTAPPSEPLSTTSSSSLPDSNQNRAPLRPAPAHPQRPTHFEVTTALALAALARASPDVVIVEVGLGGSSDATNVFEPHQLLATVVTALDGEHLQALGGSLGAVARAKAGILRRV